MSAVFDWIDVEVRVDVGEDILVLTSQNAAFSEDDYLAICTLAARAQLCDAVYGIFSKFDSGIADLTFADLLAGEWLNPNWDAQGALAGQSTFLDDAGAIFSDDGGFDLRLTTDYSISGSLAVEVVEYGSARANVRFRLLIRDFKEVTKAVVAALIAGALMASPVPTQVNAGDASYFVCSVGKTFAGDKEQIVRDAIEDLVDAPGEGDVVRSQKWKGRQACLYYAGADPGPFDGVHGTDTRKAERQVRDLHGLEVNWGNRIFIRFLLEKANDRMQRDRTYQVITRQ
ncbi:hypothetical protein GOL96_29765 [Sinorhizobium medicae]|nr:hypothetical protein [Sinorhizobium medicae]MDX1237927.1 hypothetical protein [Sinorhizobium medicae]